MRLWHQSPEKIGFCVAAVFCFALSLLYFVPWLPVLPGEDLESSWQLGMNYAAAQRMGFGSDVVFTFGPFSSAYTRSYYPGLLGWMLSITVLLAVFLTLAVVRVFPKKHAGSISIAAWGVIVSIISIFYLKDALFLIAPLMVFFCIDADLKNGKNSALSLLGIFTLASISLVKGTFAISSIALLVFAVFLPGLWKQRVVPFIFYVSSVAALWALSGQSFSGLVLHVIATKPIVSGYTDAMAFDGSIETVLVYCAAAVMALVMSLKYRSIPTTLAIGAILFFTFKAAYVRQDIHEVIAAGVLALLACILVANRVNALSLSLVAITFWLVGMTYIDQIKLPLPVLVEEWNNQAVRNAEGIHDLVFDRSSFKKRFDQRMVDLSSQNPLPEIDGTVDIYSFQQASLIASKAKWAPRPVIQSYAAFNGALAKMNAEHLSRDDRPENLIFNIEPIDGRYSAMDDGLSWPEIWKNYDLRGSAKAGLILVESKASRTVDYEDYKTIIGRLDQEISIGGGEDLVWAEIDVKKNAIGRLLGFAFRGPILVIEIKSDDGVIKRYRYLEQVGSAGFLVSPRIDTTSDFEAVSRAVYSAGNFSGKVSSIRIVQDGAWASAYQPELVITLKKLIVSQVK